jgi:glycosyltransferase involved in cell wall biosynthesis
MPKNILFIHCESDLYGSNVSLINLCTNLDPLQFKPFVVLAKDGPLRSALEERGVPVFIRKMSYLRRSCSLLFFLRFVVWFLPGIFAVGKLIRENQIDIVHTNTIHVLAGGLAGKLLHRKVIWHIREIIPSPKCVVKPWLQIICALSDSVVCISRAVMRSVSEMTGRKDKLVLIYNAVDVDKFTKARNPFDVRKEWELPESARLVLVVGRITYWKGQDIALKAAHIFCQEVQKTYVLIVGSPDRDCYQGYYEGLQKMARDMGLQDHVIFTGFREDIPSLLAQADLLLLPSTRPEPFGLVVLEALAAGVPVVATDHGGAVEILEDTGFGLLVPPGDVQSLAKATIQCLQDPVCGHSVQEKGRHYIQEHFSIKRYVKDVQSIYKSML